MNTGKWSLKKAGNACVFKTDSCKALEMKMQSRRLCIKPEQGSLQISRKLKVYYFNQFCNRFLFEGRITPTGL